MNGDFGFQAAVVLLLLGVVIRSEFRKTPPPREVLQLLTEILHLLRVVAEKVDWLKITHDVRDSDGQLLWYSRRSLEEVLERVSDSLKESSKLLQETVIQMKELRHEHMVSDGKIDRILKHSDAWERDRGRTT